MLFNCSFARAVWSQVGLTEISSTGYDSQIMDIMQNLAGKCSREMFALVLLVCWSLCNRRNRWVWDKVATSEFGVQAMAMNMLYEWRNKCEEGKGRGVATEGVSKKWRKPQQGWVKINTDGAVFME